MLGRRGAVVKGGEHISTSLYVNTSGSAYSSAGSISRDLNSQKLHY